MKSHGRRWRSSERGLTLLEAVVILGAITIMAMVALSLYSQSVTLARRNNAETDIQRAVRLAQMRLDEVLYIAEDVLEADGVAGSLKVVITQDGEERRVRFYLDGTTFRRQVTDQFGAEISDVALVENISSFVPAYDSSTYVVGYSLVGEVPGLPGFRGGAPPPPFTVVTKVFLRNRAAAD